MKNILKTPPVLSLKDKNRLSHYQFLLLALCILLGSCNDFVDVDIPKSQLTAQAVFEDVATANAAIAGLYTKMRNSGILAGDATGISCYLGLYADEFDYYQQNAVSSFYNNSLFAADLGVNDIWNQSYNQIYSANSIIEGLNKSNFIAESDKKQPLGEALFIKALLHFYLLNLYGDIPYINTTDYLQNSRVSRVPTDQVYQYIIKDLDQSIALLSENYTSTDRIRPNRSTAKALLARVYLYMKLYPEASNAASAVINNPLYVRENDLDKIFLKTSKTTIWQFMPSAAGANTSEGSLYIFTAGPPAIVALKPEFINAFEANDQRKMYWTTEVTNDGATWYYASKYKQESSTPTSVEYSILFRLAEQYLIRAEARAYQGDLIGAKEDLNIIRNTAGLSNTTAVIAEEIIKDVLNQRRFELFTEFGQRFFDLKRTGKLNETLTISKPGWNATDSFWPIPALELNANPNLKPQNQGY